MGKPDPRTLSGIVVSLLIAFSALTAQAYYIEITYPIEGATYAPCGPDVVTWQSDLPSGPGPDILTLSWRPEGGEWEAFTSDNNDGSHAWPSPPCALGWFEVRIEYVSDPSVGDTVRFFVDGTPPPPPPPFYIDITLPEPIEYHCAPSEVRWESDVDPGEGDVMEVSYSYEYGWGWNGPYTLGVSNNDGVFQWNDPPCWSDNWVFAYTYRVRVQYMPDPSVYDVVDFDLVDDGFPVDGPYGIFIDFAGDAQNYMDVVTRIDPPEYTEVEVYVALHGTEDFTSVSFALDTIPNGVLVPTGFACLLPGGLYIGSWDTGVTVSSMECMDSSEVVYLARLDMFYLSGAADIVIRDHDSYPRWVVDCEESYTYYEVASHGGVWRDPMSTPVEAMSWGAIKAMYRD